jgi:hypothetical protein
MVGVRRREGWQQLPFSEVVKGARVPLTAIRRTVQSDKMPWPGMDET